ncbi:MAG TPA: methionyl-tRNA formyltransferase [Solibacterales bacterium]|nr:methionyl-tRNA formyltransferase [Bryobacterales bacterium]
MRLVYLGTPRFAVPPLEALVRAGHHVAAVYTQPDRPKGRGQQLAASPVKEAALRLGLPVEQPERVRAPGEVERLRAIGAPAMVIVGYGQILPQAIIDLAPLGIVNVHASLLPKYRGAAPIQWAIAAGERVTGVTTMRIDAGLDTGDMLLKAETEIGPEETAVELGERLAEMGAALIVETMTRLEEGAIVPEPQDPAQATLAPILTKEDGRVDWRRPAREIANRARGFQPWPGAFTRFRGLHLALARTGVALETDIGAPGEMCTLGRRLLIGAGGGTALEVFEVQLEGKKRMAADGFLNGQKPRAGERLGE